MVGGLLQLEIMKAKSFPDRLIANTYSMSSLLLMERFVDTSIETMRSRLSEFVNIPIAVDMAFWMQAYAFDVIGECKSLWMLSKRMVEEEICHGNEYPGFTASS
jgi:hypothetical protein